MAGNTYAHRAALKGLGYRFEGHSKLWWRAMTKEGKSIADHLDIAKKELTQC